MAESRNVETKPWPMHELLSARRLEGRARARLNAWFQQKEVSEAMPRGARVTSEDYAAFRRDHPESGRELQSIANSSRLCTTSALAGTVACGVLSLRHGGSAVYMLIGGVLGGLSGGSIGDNVGSWLYGTYTFDNIATTKAFADWMRQRYPDPATRNDS